jgi:TolB-like protein
MLVSIADHAEQAKGSPDTQQAKRRAKVRSAWISFAGRIVAQIVGAAATVGFALVVLQSAPAVRKEEPTRAAPAAVATERPVVLRPTVAVLPFQTYAGTSERNHVAGAITDLLVTRLAQNSAITVTSLTSTMRFQGAPATVPEIGRQLGATHVVEGSITMAGNRARVIAQLIDASTDHHVWAKSYETTMDNALSLERRMAEQIARDLTGALSAK